jgi:hypothetical protein
MGMNLDGPIYLQRKSLLTPTKHRILDIGPQTIYFVRSDQIREFVANQGGSDVPQDKLRAEIDRLVYFSTPRPNERTTMFSEITDLTNVEYASIDVCPGLKNTEILDLNFDALPAHMRGHYDVVFNFGTTEHIFNQWNCFEVMHDAAKVGGVVYHQLPASGYLDHGYFCYTPLFFREIAQANEYEILDLFVTPAGESKIDDLNLSARSSRSIFERVNTLDDNNRIPSLNIHVLLKRTNKRPFRCGLEIATAHAPADDKMLLRYQHDKDQVSPQARLAMELAATKNLASWKITKPLRDLCGYLKTIGTPRSH